MKMLIMTFGSFTILISVVALSLYIYFNHFYEPQKINQTIDQINAFSKGYSSSDWTEEKLYDEVSKFMKKNNAIISIYSHDDLWYDFDFSLEVAETEAAYDVGTSTVIDGDVIVFPVDVGMAYYSEYPEVATKDGVEYLISSMSYMNYKQADFMKSVTLKDGSVKEIVVNISLQSVEEVVRLLNPFIPFLVILAFILSFVMTYYYSKIISKPIVAITRVANRMANMELGIRSNIQRNDELGDLSLSLNTLSSNLKNALDELVIKNEQLKKDYENEVRQEVARKEFVANVSHELKTPIGVIKGYAEGIRDGVKAEKKEYYIKVILDEIDKMDRLIVEMQEISKFDAGAVIYHKIPVQLDSLIERIVGYFQETILNKELEIHNEGDSYEVLVDEEKITRVLMNLIGNAVKHCPEKTRVIIRRTSIEEGIKISIENVSEPFSEEVKSKVWDRFYKRDLSHNREVEGSGLGLAITKSILEGHGSCYGVENTAEGVEFYFIVEKDD